MAEIIKVKPNKDGRFVFKIHGDEYDATDMLVEGKATVRLYEKEYVVEAVLPKTRKASKTKKAEESADPNMATLEEELEAAATEPKS